MVAVVLAGGSGTRLWPLARRGRPKQFLPLLGPRSLFQDTVRRAAALTRPGDILVVCGQDHLAAVRRQAPRLLRSQILVEGIGRNTAASVALAAHRVLTLRGEAILAVMPSDHSVADGRAWRADMRRAVRVARETDDLVAVGVPAARPDPGFGYLRLARRSPDEGAARVVSFVEKPSVARARVFTRRGRYLWNSGMFVWRAGRILEALARRRPLLARRAERAAASLEGGRLVVAPRLMRGIPAESIDRAVLERSRRLRGVRGRFSWSDLGTFESLVRLRGHRAARSRRGAETLSLGTKGCAVLSSSGLTVLVGIRNIVVVRSGEVVLVCGRSVSQQIRGVVSRLRGQLERFR